MMLKMYRCNFHFKYMTYYVKQVTISLVIVAFDFCSIAVKTELQHKYILNNILANRFYRVEM